MIRFKLKYLDFLKKYWLPLFLFAGCFVISAEQNKTKPDSNCRVALVESAASEENSNGVTPSKGSPNHAAVWLVAVDLGSAFAKNSHQKTDKVSGYVHLDNLLGNSGFGLAVNTLGQVDSKLGRLFTLVGEKPSGTS